MPGKRPQFAKLTRPRLYKAVARERLYTRLDEAREHKPALCVVGPPGAGKTTLIASWLDARKIKGIWYQLDSGDADLATFFYYLGEGARPFMRKGQRPLPLLAPEYRQDLDGFSRRFFRELFSRLPGDATLVLDNYQEVGSDQHFHELIAQAVGEVASGATLVAISRRDPPDAYARLLANENVGVIDWGALKLTLDEARAIGQIRDGPSERDIDTLYVECGGWAAGFTLLLDATREHGGLLPGVAVGREQLFRYFAVQGFAKLARPKQEFLAATSLLPQVSVAHASALTGNIEAHAILEDLYRRHLFTHRRSSDVPVYWYHALFREFLLAQGERMWTAAQRFDLHCRAAQILEESGQVEAAVDLLSHARAWTRVESSILRHASDVLAQGRGELLRRWIESLPSSSINGNAWLCYWLGLSLVPIDQDQARSWLQLAFEEFRATADLFGQMRAISSIVSTYFFEWSHWQPLDGWIDALEPLMLKCTTYPSREIEFDIHCSMLIATLYRRPGHRLLPTCFERVLALIDTDVDINRKIVGATLLLTYCNLANRFDCDRRIVSIALPLLSDSGVAPLNEVWWCSRFATYLNIQGRRGEVGQWTSRALEIVEHHGLKGLNGVAIILEYHRALAAMAMSLWIEAEKMVQRLEILARRTRPSDRFLVAECNIRLAMCRGNILSALQQLPHTNEAADASGMIYLRIHQMATAMQVLAEAGQFREAREQAHLACHIIRDTCFEYWEAEFRIFEAYVCWCEGDSEQGRRRLMEGFTLGARAHPQWEHACLSKRILSAMCAKAIQAGIETTYARSLIQRFFLQPPSADFETWPWMVRVYALGRFELWRDGERVRFSTKAPKKILALLKAIIAFGGRNVPEERLMDALWPDQEADAARKSLDITILRLRKLLGDPETIVVSEGMLELKAQAFWVDALAFERRVAEADSGECNASEIDAMIDLYKGSFLPQDIEEPWSVRMRERLRGKFVRLVESAARREEAASQWQQAIALYEKGLEADELTESFYQGLMRCHRALGRIAEAMGVFRKMRHLLSVVLGIAPSETSQALANALLADNPARYEAN